MEDFIDNKNVTYQLKKEIIEFEKKFRGFFVITIFKGVSSVFGCSD